MLVPLSWCNFVSTMNCYFHVSVNKRVLLWRVWNFSKTTAFGLQAFATIAESPLKIDLSSVLEQVVTELTTFLRKVRNEGDPFYSLKIIIQNNVLLTCILRISMKMVNLMMFWHM